jgi:hypothetical protein
MLHKPKARALAALALFTLLTVVAATANGLHRHDNSSREACQLCKVGHMPALQTGAAVIAPSLGLVAWHVASIAFQPDLDPVLGTGPTRAPPSA